MRYIVQGPRLHVGPLPYASARLAALYQSCLAWNATVWIVEDRPTYPTVQAFERGRDVTREVFEEFPDMHDYLDEDGGYEDASHDVRNSREYQ